MKLRCFRPKFLSACLLMLLLSSLAFAQPIRPWIALVERLARLPPSLRHWHLCQRALITPSSLSGTCTENIFDINRTDLSVFGHSYSHDSTGDANRQAFVYFHFTTHQLNLIVFNGGRGIFVNSSSNVSFDFRHDPERGPLGSPASTRWPTFPTAR